MKKFIGYLISFAFMAFGIFSLFQILTGNPEYIYGVFIFTAPGGVGVAFQFNMNYLPEFITYNHGGNQLTSLRVETQEDGVLHDWVAASLNAMNGYRFNGALPANNILLRVADGQIDNKNVLISGVTSAIGAINIFAGSDNVGIVPFKTANANILALNPTTFRKFTAVFMPGLVTVNDRVEVSYDDGHTQIFDAVELRNLSSIYQEVSGIILDNLAGNIKKAVVTSAAGLPAYVLSVALPSK